MPVSEDEVKSYALLDGNTKNPQRLQLGKLDTQINKPITDNFHYLSETTQI